MLELLETLQIVHETGTMSQAATVLRVSQSAVSKRIVALEYQLKTKLLSKEGRYVRLTEKALNILEKANPLLIELRDAIQISTNEKIKISIGISESILTSWGAVAIGNLMKKFSEIEIIPHTHRSPVVLDKVRSGHYQLGICAGACIKAPDLIRKELGRESMVLINKHVDELPLFTIEENSETWVSIERQMKREHLTIDRRMESFAAMAQLAKAKYMRAVIPAGMAHAFAIKKDQIDFVQVQRPIVMVARKNILKDPTYKQFLAELQIQFTRELDKLSL